MVFVEHGQGCRGLESDDWGWSGGIFRLVFCLAVWWFIWPGSGSAALQVGDLRCEYLIDPEGIIGTVDGRPRLSWVVTSPERGQRQTAYRIMVASTSDRLRRNAPDLWDSGKVLSDETLHIPYGGRALEPFMECHWKVMVWDKDGKPSAWSRPARWSVGPMSMTDWGNAKWIGLDGIEHVVHLTNTWWIWHPAEPEAHRVASNATNYFRRLIVIPTNKPVRLAIFQFTGDDMARGWLNGSDLGARNNPRNVKFCDITQRLLPGTNVLGLTGYNSDTNTAGVVGSLLIEFADGSSMFVPTDAQWKVFTNAVEGWLRPGFDDSGWTAARVLGPVGMQPWGEVRAAEDRRLPARWLRKEFEITKPVKRAVVYHSGLGLSELYLNGVKVGDRVLSPALSYYSNRVFYLADNVTDRLRTGRNALGVILGNGRFYADRSRVYAGTLSFGFPKLLLKLRIEYVDGSVDEIVSDESWKITDCGPIRANSEYDGEEYDARLEMPGWASPGFDDSAWRNAQVVAPPAGVLVPQMTPPIRVMQTIKPVAMHEPAPGVYIFDMGQNMVGWCRLKVQGPAGTTIKLRHAERLNPDGTLFVANLRGARATDIYTLKGVGTEVYEPRFTYHGFRYVELTGYPGRPTLETLEGRVVHDALEQTGSFECSHPLVNRIYSAVVWGIRGNYRSIPTDCPQRDERQGWLGDRSEESLGESYVFNVAPLYRKWLVDIMDSQRPNGSIPDVAPPYWPIYSDNVTWPSTFIIAQNMLLRQYADVQPVQMLYPAACKWITHMRRFITNDLIARDNYGDWCVPPEEPQLIHTRDTNRITAKVLLASAYFYHDLRLMEKYARILGRDQDAGEFAELAARIKARFNETLLNRDAGCYDNGTPTSSVLPLAFDMVPEEWRGPVFGNLIRKLMHDFRGHIGTGLIGCQHLMRTLSDFGRADLAWLLATNETYPSWGYMIRQGATTIWELWNGDTADPEMNSGNHVMLVGDLVVWLYEYLAGIAPDPSQPGFKHIVMKPHPVPGLDRVSASYRSVRGMIKSAWSKSGDSFTWTVMIPANTTATLWIPSANPNSVTVDDKPLSRLQHVELIGYRAGYTVCRVPSGAYSILAK